MQQISETARPAKTRTPIPRGIARNGPPILSYGFRPFFLLAGAFAIVAMSGWIGALALGWEIGGSYGALNWHAHEMLFGYASAALAGFMLTAIPNWTGRLPVSGGPLLVLVAVWLSGRIALAAPDLVGVVPSALVDGCFLPLMAAIAAREIIAGKNWKNLKILAGLVGLSLANGAFHYAAIAWGDSMTVSRIAVGIYITLIALVGGRIVPSFTRNWLVKAGSPSLPLPYSHFDTASIVALAAAMLVWAVADDNFVAAPLAFAACGLQAFRLWRWVGWRTTREPLLLVLHVGYGFIPLGLFCVGLAELGFLSAASALHVLTVGAIGMMTLAVMTRASRGHTGRPLAASRTSTLAYLALGVAAAVRPFAEAFPDAYRPLLEVAAAGWIVAFALFLIEYGPMLIRRSAR